MNGWVLLSLDKEGRLSDGAELGYPAASYPSGFCCYAGRCQEKVREKRRPAFTEGIHSPELAF